MAIVPQLGVIRVSFRNLSSFTALDYFLCRFHVFQPTGANKMFTCEFLLISAVFQCADRLTPLELNTLSRCSQTAFKYTRYILLVFIEITYLRFIWHPPVVRMAFVCTYCKSHWTKRRQNECSCLYTADDDLGRYLLAQMKEGLACSSNNGPLSLFYWNIWKCVSFHAVFILSHCPHLDVFLFVPFCSPLTRWALLALPQWSPYLWSSRSYGGDHKTWQQFSHSFPNPLLCSGEIWKCKVESGNVSCDDNSKPVL